VRASAPAAAEDADEEAMPRGAATGGAGLGDLVGDRLECGLTLEVGLVLTDELVASGVEYVGPPANWLPLSL
jgi:hypothetical protein